MVHMWRSEDSCGNLLCPSTMWVPEVKLGFRDWREALSLLSPLSTLTSPLESYFLCTLTLMVTQDSYPLVPPRLIVLPQ